MNRLPIGTRIQNRGNAYIIVENNIENERIIVGPWYSGHSSQTVEQNYYCVEDTLSKRYFTYLHNAINGKYTKIIYNKTCKYRKSL
jgi:hypothetical protein